VRIDVDLRGIERPEAPDVLHAIAQHYDLEVTVLEKAHVGGEWPDERSPKLTRLVELARASWTEWGDKLVDELVALANAGKLSPISEETERALVDLFTEHEAALVVRLTGRAPQAMVDRLVRRGLISPLTQQQALLPVAFKLGRALDVMQELPKRPESRADLAELVREAAQVKLSPRDQAALEHIQQNGFALMRRPATAATTTAMQAIVRENSRKLSAEELQPLRAAAEKAHLERASKTRWREVLHEAVNGNATLQNDLDRIARTEGINAHAQGAYATLKARAGAFDTDVFKYTSPKACTQCKRIWGPPDNPRVYKLSVIEAHEAAGGNFHVPADQWGPTIGATHPNCACSPLQRWSRAVALANERAKQILGR